MKKYFQKSSILFTILFISVSLTDAQNHNLPNIATIYNPQYTTLHPEFLIFNKNDNVSTIFGKINLKELNFIKQADRSYLAKLKLKFIFYNSLESTNIIDSISKSFDLKYKNIKQSIVLSVDIIPPNDSCYLIIISKDLNNNKKNLNILTLNRKKKSAQNIILLDSATNSPIFNKFLKPYKTYYVNSRYKTDSILVKKYQNNNKITTSPGLSGTNKFQPNFLSAKSYKSNEYLKFSDKGIYKISALNYNFSRTFITIDEYFPYILKPYQMVKPLRYISTTAEFNELKQNPNKKLAVDNFWLKRNKKYSEARKLIKIYFNRVAFANLKFTTTKPGWMTHRGMIYIVMGPPNILHKGDLFEEWIYYDRYSGKKLTVFFNKYSTDFFVDYELKKNNNLNKQWKKALEIWNSGKVFTF